jgi:predicted protein tyrosine phosphatase
MGARIHVCPLSRLDEKLVESGATSMVSLLRADEPAPRRATITHHLILGLSDIDAPREGHTAPSSGHVGDLVSFAAAWDRRRPLLIHCYAGVSRSTAAAFAVACALAPERDEVEIAQTIRALSPTATPNRLFVHLADACLGRSGRMVEAVRRIGRGRECFEGVPFALDVT